MNLDNIEYALYDRHAQPQSQDSFKIIGYGFIERAKTIDVVCSAWVRHCYETYTDAGIRRLELKAVPSATGGPDSYKPVISEYAVKIVIHPSPIPIRKIRLDLNRYPTIFTCLSQSMHLAKSVCELSLGPENNETIEMIAMANMAQEIEKIKATY